MAASNNELEIVLLYCQRCVADESSVAVAAEKAEGLTVRPVMLPCSSKIQVSDLLKLLDNGADGIEVVACPSEGCRFLVGSCRAEKRVDYAKRLMSLAGLEGDRIGLSRCANISSVELIELAARRGEAIRKVVKEGGAQ